MKLSSLSCLLSLLLIVSGCTSSGQPATKPSAKPAVNVDPAQATAEITKLGGKITVDDKAPGQPVVGVNLSGAAVSDQTLAILAAFPQLQALDIGRTSKQTQATFTDAGLAQLKSLPNLQRLSLGGTDITDVGLANLKGLKHLQHLNLERTKVTDASLAALIGFSELNRVKLKGTAITDAGVAKLQSGLPNCRVER